MEPDVSPLITIVIAVLSSSVIAAIIASRAAYKSIAVEAITMERIEWLDELRDIARQFATELAKIWREQGIQSCSPDFHKLDNLSAQLELHLNPNGKKEQSILEKAKALRAVSEKKDCDEYRKVEAEFMLEVRELLKQEWDKAKAEAGVWKSNNFPQPEFRLFLVVAALAGLLAVLSYNGAF